MALNVIFLILREQYFLEVQSLLPPSYPATMSLFQSLHLSKVLRATAEWAIYPPAVYFSDLDLKHEFHNSVGEVRELPLNPNSCAELHQWQPCEMEQDTSLWNSTFTSTNG